MSRSGTITVWVLLYASLPSASAQQITQIDDFLKPIVTKIAADPNVGAWEWEANRNGGYLLRRFMDVTGDGRPEVFVASTLESHRNEHAWHVFEVAADGKILPYNEPILFDVARPVTQNGQTSLDLFPVGDDERLRASERKSHAITHYWFDYPEISETITYVSVDEAIKLQPTNYAELPKLQAILLSDYMTNPSAKWSDVTELKLDANGCYYIDEDKERAENNTAFTPQAALSRLGLGQSIPNGSKSQTNTRQLKRDKPPLISQQPVTKNPVPSTPSVRRPSPMWWPVVAVVVVTALGLMWMRLMKRK